MTLDTGEKLEEEIRAFMAATLPKLPESVTQLMLADSEVRANLGLPDGDFVRIFDKPFNRADLFRTLRDIANGRPASLTSADGAFLIEKTELRPDGSAILFTGIAGVGFTYVGMLSDDEARRFAALDMLVSTGELSTKQEARWRAALEQGPLSDADYAELEEEIDTIPEGFLRRLRSEAASGLSFSAMVPEEVETFAGLLGIEQVPDSLGHFRGEWLEIVAALDPHRLARILVLCAPLSILRGDLIAPAAAGLGRDQRLRLAKALAQASDPFSMLAAFQIVAANAADPDFRDIGDAALAQLVDGENKRMASGAMFLSSALIVTTAVTARRRTLLDWPLYARRLSTIVHASHLTRTFSGRGAESEDLAGRAGQRMLPQAVLIKLIEAREDPTNVGMIITPAQVHALLLGRVQETLWAMAEEERPQQWVGLLDKAVDSVAKSADALLLMAPLPFDRFEHGWTGLVKLTQEQTDQIVSRICGLTDTDAVLSDLIKLSVAFEAGECQRDAIAKCILAFVKLVPDEIFSAVLELSLQIGARWRDPTLAESLISLAVNRAAVQGLADASAAPRLILLGAASSEDEADWARCVGDYAARFAAVSPPGPAVLNLANAINLISDIAPLLRQPLERARSFTLLARDKLPLRLHSPDAEQEEVGSGPPDPEEAATTRPSSL